MTWPLVTTPAGAKVVSLVPFIISALTTSVMGATYQASAMMSVNLPMGLMMVIRPAGSP